MAASPAAVRRRRIDGWALLLLPALAFLLLLFAYPLFEVLKRSFTDPATGFDNYSAFFHSATELKVMGRTFQTAAIVTVVCLVLGYPYAYLMTVVSRRWQIVLLGLVLLPFWTSLMVRTYAWLILLQDTGVINDGLAALGFERVRLIRNTSGVTIGMAQILLPFMVLPLFATMQRIDRRLLSAAWSLGASPAVAFLRVYLPLSVPGLAAGATLVFVLALGFFVTPALLGSTSNSLLSQLIVQQISQLLDWGRGGALAGLLFAFTLALMGIVSLLVRFSSAHRGGTVA